MDSEMSYYYTFSQLVSMHQAPSVSCGILYVLVLSLFPIPYLIYEIFHLLVEFISPEVGEEYTCGGYDCKIESEIPMNVSFVD